MNGTHVKHDAVAGLQLPGHDIQLIPLGFNIRNSLEAIFTRSIVLVIDEKPWIVQCAGNMGFGNELRTGPAGNRIKGQPD